MTVEPLVTSIVFMGTPEFAVPTLKGLVQARYAIQAVYTQPPRPKGRGHLLQKSPVHLFAESLGLPVFTPSNLKEEGIRTLRQLSPSLVIVVAYGLILPKSILDIPRYGCLNIHASLLPRWRGAAPIQYALLEGDAVTGITLMAMDTGMDTGPMIAQKHLEITSTETSASLTHSLAQIGADLLLESLPAYLTGERSLIPQPSEGIRYAPKLKSIDGRIQWANSAVFLERQVRALKTWFMFKGKRFRVSKAEVILLPESQFPDLPGTIQDTRLRVACGNNSALRPLVLTPEGGHPMDLDAFLHGHGPSFSPGTLLT